MVLWCTMGPLGKEHLVLCIITTTAGVIIHIRAFIVFGLKLLFVTNPNFNFFSIVILNCVSKDAQEPLDGLRNLYGRCFSCSNLLQLVVHSALT